MELENRTSILEEKVKVLEEKIEEIKLKKEKMRTKCALIENTIDDCCNKKIFEERIIAYNELKNLIKEFKKFNENSEKRNIDLNARLDAYEKRLVVHEKYFLIGVGVLITLESLGIGDLIRQKIIGG